MGIGRKRRRGGGELCRAAEIVMVLAAAGQARGGRAPTAAERALTAEARGALAAVVAGQVSLRPRELFATEAIRALVEDLGLAWARDPAAVGFCKRRASIADKVLLTKRKMEGRREVLVPTVPKMTAASAKIGFQHGASKVTTGLPRNQSNPMSSSMISKQPPLNGAVAGASSIESRHIPSAVSLPAVCSANAKMEVVVNGSNFTQNGGEGTIEESNKSGHHTANSSSQSSLRISSQAEKSVDEKRADIYPVSGGSVMGYEAPKGALFIQKQIILSNHKAITGNVQWILHQPADHSSWNVPSTEYMNTRLDCQICKVPITDMESLLVCDACERGMHVKCLQHYGNQDMVKPEWYCPRCVAFSKGKPLPPKYGKVTRTIVVPKACMTSVALPSQVAVENPTEKDGSSNKNVAADGHLINQNTNKVGIAVCKSGTLALYATDSKAPSVAEPQKEDVKHDETSSIGNEGNGLPCGGIPTETATFCDEVQSTGASTYGSGNLSGGPQMHVKSSSASPTNYFALQSTELSAINHANHSSIVSSVENCERTRASADELYQADGVTNDGIGKPHKREIMADDAISDHVNAHQVTLNRHCCSDPETIGDCNRYLGSSTDSVVVWVGDGLKSIGNKTFYNSCNIDGIVYNLHDHILIASEGSKSSPCKLQSLWEDHDSGSRVAMVNPYFFGSDIPESISKPCIYEEEQVYGSNDEKTVLVSAIRGPCEVLHVDKLSEETMRRCQLDSSGHRLHPIFFCRSLLSAWFGWFC
ncbi:hypothetical protein HU200_002872 [Digitaria exilis]|uniref:PHD-type domain-containing protein n=1 Tax=Digitaria exilis TaxID=1010633 RepID=A0A835FWA3_9POAL|nr:hypothetical protein HU200_002872 [Digitaria exilis]